MATSPRVVRAVCSHDCPDSCAVLVTVDDAGRATRVEGDPGHPVTRGFLCGKVARYLERVYSPERLLYPLRRRPGAPKGALARGRELDSFDRIGWDQALDEIAARLGAIARDHGPESILPYSYAGTIGVLGYGSMDRRFFTRLGASQLHRTICAEVGGEAFLSVYGRKLGTDPEDFHRARLILAWGANIHGNSIHLWPQIEAARRAGARLIVIDPYRTRTAALADLHLAIHPGTDAALALAMMHVILEEGLEDRNYIAAHTHGFPQLAAHVRSSTPALAEQATGIPAEQIIALAREYATTAPAVIRMNYGVQRAENGGSASRAIAMLPALTGAWRHRGGGVLLSTSGAFVWDRAALERPELAAASPLGRRGRTINMSLLGEALTGAGAGAGPDEGPPVQALFVYNSNPAAVAPNQSAVLRGLGRSDLFTVVHEQFLTDTTDYADYVLPATTFLEHGDVQGAYGHYHLQLSRQAIAPLGEARSNVWLFSRLARRMGFSEPCFDDGEQDLIAQALGHASGSGPGQGSSQGSSQGPATIAAGRTQNPGMPQVTLAELEAQCRLRVGPPAGALPFGDGVFPTPSGRIELFSEALAAQGLPPLPTFVPPTESRHRAGPSYPLELLARKADNYLNSTFSNLDGHRRMERGFNQQLEIHAQDAAARGIASGDAVEVQNDRGSLRLTALVSERVPPGVVAGRLDANKFNPGAANLNTLTSERLADMGGGPTFYSTLVEVRKL